VTEKARVIGPTPELDLGLEGVVEVSRLVAPACFSAHVLRASVGSPAGFRTEAGCCTSVASKQAATFDAGIARWLDISSERGDILPRWGTEQAAVSNHLLHLVNFG
jgi:hypothetical protein